MTVMNVNWLNKQKLCIFSLIFSTKYLAFKIYRLDSTSRNSITINLDLFYKLSSIKCIQDIPENNFFMNLVYTALLNYCLSGKWKCYSAVFFFLDIFVCFWPDCLTCRTLVPIPGIEPGPSAMKVWSPSYWTAREYPLLCFRQKSIVYT